MAAPASCPSPLISPAPPVLDPRFWWPDQPLPPRPDWGVSPRSPSPAPLGRAPLVLAPVVLAPLVLALQRTPERAGFPSAPLLALLDGGEQQRAHRYRRPEDRQRFLLGRAALRLLLGAWLERDPAALCFRQGPHGKPALVDAGAAAPHFNLAHSGDLILLAFHPERPVGVDVERLRPRLDWLPIARRVLNDAEVAALQALPPERGAQAFLAHWCRLEARLKASGEGLAGLERLRRPPGSAGPAGPFCWDVAVPAGYRASVALAPPA